MKYIWTIGVLALFIFTSCDNKKNKTTPTHKTKAEVLPKGVVPIPVDSLDAEYTSYPAEADRKYKDKWIYVSGTIKNIHSTDIFGITSISLRVGTGAFGHVLCTSHGADFISGHQKNEDVIIKGKCAGTMLTHVQLRECVTIPINF